MKRMRITAVFCLLVLLGLAVSARAETRAAFDIGSVTLRMQVAEFHTVDGTLRMASKDRDEARIDLAADMAANAGAISVEKIDAVAAVLQGLAEKARAMGADKLLAVAGSSFREAANGRAAANRLRMLSGVEVLVLSSREEGALNMAGAALRAGAPRDNLCMWDIGGTSMHILCSSTTPAAEYDSSVASVTFRDRVIRQVQSADPAQKPSPNPLGVAGAQRAVALAAQLAADVPPGVGEALSASGVVVAGVGGVHAKSIAGQLGDMQPYDAARLQALLARQALLDDAAIGGDYADTQVSNIALVLGYMNALRIRQVVPVAADITDGLLVSPGYWPNER